MSAEVPGDSDPERQESHPDDQPLADKRVPWPRTIRAGLSRYWPSYVLGVLAAWFIVLGVGDRIISIIRMNLFSKEYYELPFIDEGFLYSGVAFLALSILLATYLHPKVPSGVRERIEGESAPIHYTISNQGDVHIGTPVSRTSESLRIQEKILHEIYYQRIDQTRRTFRLSLYFAVLGGLIILCGAATAIWHAGSNGDKYASILVTTSGVATSAIAALVYALNTKSQDMLTKQAQSLREDSQYDRKMNMAREIVESVVSEEQRDILKAELVSSFIEPIVEAVGKNDRVGPDS